MWTRSTEQKKKWTPKLANPRWFFEEFYAFLSLTFAFILRSGLFFDEICVCLSVKLPFILISGLFSRKFVLVFRRNLRFFVVEICVYFVFFKELYAYLPKKVAFVFQGKHLFSKEFALTFKELYTCFVVEICTCFSMKIEPVFSWRNFRFFFWWIFHLFFHEIFICGFQEISVFGDYTPKYARYEDEPKCENGENRVVYTPLGSIWSLDPLGPRNFDIISGRSSDWSDKNSK